MSFTSKSTSPDPLNNVLRPNVARWRSARTKSALTARPEQRACTRQPLPLGAALPVKLWLGSRDEPLFAALTDVAYQGFGLTIDASEGVHAQRLAAEDCRLEVSLEDGAPVAFECSVRHVEALAGGALRVGLVADFDGARRRAFEAYKRTAALPMPLDVHLKNPLFVDYQAAQIVECGGAHVVCETESTAFAPVAGMRVALHAAGFDKPPLEGVVAFVDASPSTRTRFGLDLERFDPVYRELVSAAMLEADASLTPAHMAGVGMSSRALHYRVKCRKVTGEAHWQELANFWRLHKEPARRCRADFADRPGAGQLWAYYDGGQLVATMALSTGGPRLVPEHVLPKAWREVSSYLEVSHCCVRPSYRQSELVTRLCQDMRRAARAAGRSHLALIIDPRLGAHAAFDGFERAGRVALDGGRVTSEILIAREHAAPSRGAVLTRLKAWLRVATTPRGT